MVRPRTKRSRFSQLELLEDRRVLSVATPTALDNSEIAIPAPTVEVASESPLGVFEPEMKSTDSELNAVFLAAQGSNNTTETRLTPRERLLAQREQRRARVPKGPRAAIIPKVRLHGDAQSDNQALKRFQSEHPAPVKKSKPVVTKDNVNDQLKKIENHFEDIGNSVGKFFRKVF